MVPTPGNARHNVRGRPPAGDLPEPHLALSRMPGHLCSFVFPLIARRLPLWIWLLFSWAVTCLLALWFPLLPHHRTRPVRDIVRLAPSLGAAGLYVLLLIALFALLGLAYWRLQQEPDRSPWRRPGRILLGSFLLSLPLLVTFPLNATDIYRYYIRGRIGAVYGRSPYVHPPADFPGDPYLSLAGEWAANTSPYGPLWESVAFAISRLAGAHLLAALMLFKLLGLGLMLATGYILWRALAHRAPDLAAGRLLLWAWNPALLLTFVANGHNDSLMLGLLVLGWALMPRRPLAGWLVGSLAALAKPIGLLALPFLFLHLWRHPAGPSRTRLILLAAGGSLALAGLAFAPFGQPMELGRRLIFESQEFAGFSPATLLILIGQRAGIRVDLSLVGAATTALFGLFFLWLLYRAWRGRSALASIADAFGGYVLLALSFRIWYASWLFPWLLLDTGRDDDARRQARDRLAAGMIFLLTTQLSVVLYGQIRLRVLAGDHLLAHLVGVPLVFGLPLLWRFRGAGRQRRS